MRPCVTVVKLHQKTTESQPSITVVRNSYVHVQNRLHLLTVPKSKAKNSNVLKLWKDSQGTGQFANDLQGRIRAFDSDPRTGTFHQTRVIKEIPPVV